MHKSGEFPFMLTHWQRLLQLAADIEGTPSNSCYDDIWPYTAGLQDEQLERVMHTGKVTLIKAEYTIQYMLTL